MKGLVTRRRTVHIGILVLACGIVYHYSSIDRYNNFLSCLMYPVLVLQNKCVAPIKAWMHKKESVEVLEQQLIAAQQEKEALLADVIKLQASLGYAADSKELIAFRQRYDCSHAVLAQVLVKHISDEVHFFILDAGERKGIKKNMVAVYKDHLIGKVIEVYPYYCKVLLITDRTCKVSAYCATTKASGIHVGTNTKNSGQLLHVSHLASLENNDMLLSSGDGLIFPRGFCVGRIRNAQRNELHYDISTELMVDLRTIQACYLLQKGNDTITYLSDSIEHAHAVQTVTENVIAHHAPVEIKKDVIPQMPLPPEVKNADVCSATASENGSQNFT
jgi:cell shape-determining protein MreC